MGNEETERREAVKQWIATDKERFIRYAREIQEEERNE